MSNRVATLCIALFGMFYIAVTSAQESTEEDIKTAFIFNFINYIEWPEEARRSELVIGYIGDNSQQYKALQKLAKAKVRKIGLDVKRINQLKQVEELDIIYVDASHKNILRALNAQFVDKTLLVITSEVADKQLFGINFIKEQKVRIGFEVNRYNLINRKLRVSSDIVILGGTEIDIASLVRDLESNIEQGLVKLEDVRREVAQKQSMLDQQQSQMRAQAAQIERQQSKLLELDKTIKSQQASQEKLRTEYQAMKESLENSRNELVKNNDLLGTKQAELESKTAAIDDLANLIDKNKQLLLEQSSNLAIQKEELRLSQEKLNVQKNELEKQSMTIKNQTLALYGSIVIILSVGLSIILIYRGYKLKKQSHEVLEKKNVELEEINYKLTSAQDQLVEAEKMAALGSLVAGVAHEINTPIGVGVTSATHLLDAVKLFEKKYKAGELKRSELESLIEDLTESGQILNRNLARASSLIRSFKQVSADQTNEEIRSFSIADYLDEICQNLRHKLKQKHHKVSIECDPDIQIKSYPGAISQVFTNLIFNSVIHGFGEERIEGKITINCQLEEDWLVINYRDNGKGITDEQTEKVFDPFFTTNRSQGGTGLGLHICFNLVSQKLKGTISCLKSKGGAHFVFKIPLSID